MAISREFKVGLPADHGFQDGPQNGRRSMELVDMQQLSSFSTHFIEISMHATLISRDEFKVGLSATHGFQDGRKNGRHLMKLLHTQ